MRTFPMAALVRPGQSQPRPSEDSPANYKSMSDEVHRPATPEKAGRSSFSSLRENDSNLVQAFTLSKTSSYLVTNEAAVEESPLPANDMVEAQFCPPVTQPYSRLHGYWAPADTFKGWKQINVKGKLASKSFGDLQVLNSAWTNAAVPHRPGGACAPGDAPIERLPIELLGSIINLLVLDIPPNGIARRNVDLMSLLLTSKTLHLATLNTLYSKITIPHSRIFQKFLAHVSTHESLGTIVRRLDFCHFNPSQLFSTASERSQARNLTSETLLQCLDLTPYLQEFLAQEYIEDDLDGNVLQKLFFGLPRLQAVDFCGCSSAHFKDAFSSILQLDWPTQLSIRRLSMHKCMTLPSSVFETVLPRLANLTHLDVAGTRITDEALASIPATAKITHLNLSKCRQLTAVNVIKFLATHPAVRSTLTFLSLATDARSHQLFDVEDVAELLPVLPPTLKSLSLRGSKMDKSHIDLLIPLTKHLEELAVGRCLKLEDINKLFLPDETQGIEGQLEWVPQALRYIDVSDLWGSDLDLGFLFGNHCAMLKRFSEPLEVIELADDAIKRLTKSPMILQRAGWRISECGSRSWLVRQESDGRRNDGRRPWKMGAEAWGMRKIPVARAEVGGMYGSFMFSRRL